MMPDSIHDYTILDEIGEGGFGKVFKVESVDKRQYALKLISVTKDNKDEAKKEAELHVTLDHPNILKAREFFFFNKEKYLTIILEYCPDGSLCSLIGRSSNDSFRKVLKEIAEGLAYLHRNNIIHRDIKPENVLILKGEVKITDLGVSKIMKTSGISTKIGTPFYLAWEVFHEEKYDNKADIWSFGIMALELLVGKRIYDMVKGMLAPSLIEGFPSAALLNQIKDKQMKELVQMMLKKKPVQRLTSHQVLDFLKGEKGKKQEIQKKQQEINSESLQKQQQVLKKEQKPQYQIKKLNINYKFSEQHKSKMINLTNENSTSTNPGINLYYEMALVQGPVAQKGSLIRFKILQICQTLGVGLGIRNVITANSYKIKDYGKIGHGCFLLTHYGYSLSHSNKDAENGFKYGKGDVILVETNEDELWFMNEAKKKVFKMKIKLTEEEWRNACFCVLLYGFGDAVQIQ